MRASAKSMNFSFWKVFGSKVLGDYTHFLGFCYGLGASLCVELGEEIGDVRFYGAWGNKQFFGNILVREPSRDELEDLVFAAADAKAFQCGAIKLEGCGRVDDL